MYEEHKDIYVVTFVAEKHLLAFSNKLSLSVTPAFQYPLLTVFSEVYLAVRKLSEVETFASLV